MSSESPASDRPTVGGVAPVPLHVRFLMLVEFLLLVIAGVMAGMDNGEFNRTILECYRFSLLTIAVFWLVFGSRRLPLRLGVTLLAIEFTAIGGGNSLMFSLLFAMGTGLPLLIARVTGWLEISVPAGDQLTRGFKRTQQFTIKDLLLLTLLVAVGLGWLRFRLPTLKEEVPEFLEYPFNVFVGEIIGVFAIVGWTVLFAVLASRPTGAVRGVALLGISVFGFTFIERSGLGPASWWITLALFELFLGIPLWIVRGGGYRMVIPRAGG